MVRKIKSYNREKIKVKIDGKTYRMHFKKAQKAIAKAEKSFFRDDGVVEIYTKQYDAWQKLDEMEKNAQDQDDSRAS